MLDEDQPTSQPSASQSGETAPVVKKTTRKRATKKAAPAPEASSAPESTDTEGEAKPAARRRTTKKTVAAPETESTADGDTTSTPVVKKTARKRAPKKLVEVAPAEVADESISTQSSTDSLSEAGEQPVVAKKTTARKRATKKTAAPAAQALEPTEQPTEEPTEEPTGEQAGDSPSAAKKTAAKKSAAKKTASKKTAAKKTASKKTAVAPTGPAVLFQVPTAVESADSSADPDELVAADALDPVDGDEAGASGAPDVDTAGDAESGGFEPGETDEDAEGEGSGPARRRRRRGGRRRRRSGSDSGEGAEGGDDSEDADGSAEAPADAQGGEAEEDENGDSTESPSAGTSSSRRRRRRRRAGEDNGESADDDPSTVTRIRQSRSPEDQIQSVSGSTRLEAKKQRRREGREAGRRRAPIVSEAEFLARRESVDRVMVIRQRDDLTQIAVLEDKVLVEHYVARESQTSLIGNVYLGRVQNVLPSMEAAFIDIGKGRNAVLYAGEVNWSALGHKEGQPRKIESVLQSGQSVLVQVTKDPVGHKGARLTSQISLAGRFLVYVPDGTTSGISRKLPDTERNRLKSLLKEIVPDTAGVIVRTAAEGASEEELTRDVERLKARWEDIEKKSAGKGASAQLLYGEPDLTLKVVRDLFTEDFTKLVIEGTDAWETVEGYVSHVAPDLQERLERFEPATEGRDAGKDVFATYRIEEQIHKGLDRKVWLPSGGSLVIDRTEAMTVVDVNTGKFTGSGGNLEETVTKNNLEAAEEIVRQLRLRDIGGIIVVDFIDMVLESNRDLVLRRLVECLGRDRTRHQVAEVTSLGLVQMTRKRIGTGLLEAFSENCEHCHGRGVLVQDKPIEPNRGDEDSGRGNTRRSRGRGRRGGGEDAGSLATGRAGQGQNAPGNSASEPTTPEPTTTEPPAAPSPADLAAMPRPEQPETPVEPEPSSAPESPSTPESPSEPQAAAETAAEAAPAAVAEPAAEPAPEPAPEPVVAEAPVEAPKVVTRTRRRSASRPAGPPAERTEAETAAAAAQLPVAAGESRPVPPPVVEHVPIKKRGARKR